MYGLAFLFWFNSTDFDSFAPKKGSERKVRGA